MLIRQPCKADRTNLETEGQGWCDLLEEPSWTEAEPGWKCRPDSSLPRKPSAKPTGLLPSTKRGGRGRSQIKVLNYAAESKKGN